MAVLLDAAVGAPFGSAVQTLCKVVGHAVKEARMFKPHLESLQSKLQSLDEWVEKIRELNVERVNKEEELIKLMNEGKELVEKCLRISEWNPTKCIYGSKLSKLEEDIQKFLDFFLLLESYTTLKRLEADKQNHGSQNLDVRSDWMGCAVPPPPKYTGGLDVHIEELKRKLLNEKESLLALIAPRGSGKTTLAKMLGHDEQIKGVFKKNIFFLSLSKAPNLRVIASDLFIRNGYQVPGFQSDEDAINQVGVLFSQIKAPILLILDDVQPESESFVNKFQFNIPDYQILVTSRTVIKGYGFTYTLPSLSDEDTKTTSSSSDQELDALQICQPQVMGSEAPQAIIYEHHEAPKSIISGLKNKLTVLGRGFFGYRRVPKRRKQKCFSQNGGSILEWELHNEAGSNKIADIFTIKELKKATKNFHESKIIGRGSFGTFYKGILLDDRIVAIKKYKTVNQSQKELFILELVSLFRINHRNIVKLLGCCLETKVPLLVYEFVSNRTLFEYIHHGDRLSPIRWETRIKIAGEVAEALSHLHSATLKPIIHKDIKSANILIDDGVTPKVFDFGISRLVSQDQGKLVQGTLGYLDPEYLQTNQLTKESDVYSFGVVIIELLTGNEAFSIDRSEEERSLAMYFLSYLKQDRIIDIIDNDIVEDGNKKQIKEAAKLANRCLKVNGVAQELERIRKMNASPLDDPQSYKTLNNCLVRHLKHTKMMGVTMELLNDKGGN